MKLFLSVVFYCFLFSAMAGNNALYQSPISRDTVIEDQQLEDEIIEDVIKTKAPPAKDKVQYFSQVTKYGFKNLFANYSYNPGMSYASQINSNANGFIEGYMKAHGKYLQGMKSWGQPYFNLMEGILMQYGLPRELKYIAVIESNLKTGAVSSKGAGGPWQLMPGTARELGLSVNYYTDDRIDYFKSTHAAAKYLLKNYRIFHDWLLVMAAYNGGAGRVFNAIKKSGSKNFWALQYYLPEESRTYVKRFIATHYIMEGGGGITTMASANTGFNNAGFGRTGGGLPSENPYDKKPVLTEEELSTTETQTISGKFNSLVISKNLVMDIAQFNRFNPEFDAMMSTNGNYDLRLPEDKMQLFLVNKYVILNECVQLLLGENSISGNQTFYPSQKPVKAGARKKRR
jgi:membrane-bound lytic murein transglycosylase D